MTKTPAQEKRTKVFAGTVVSSRMKDTAVVLIKRFVMHSKYKKFLLRTKRLQAHDPGNAHAVGSAVRIQEVRPISKHKHFKIIAETTES